MNTGSRLWTCFTLHFMVMADPTRKIQTARIVTILLSVCGVALSYIALDQHVRYANGFATGS